MTSHEKDIAQNSKNEGLKRAVGAKVATREANKEQYNANKAALAKRNAELEKKHLEIEIANKRLQKQLDSANVDKAKFKRMYEDEKRKRGSIDDPMSLALQPSSIGHSLKDQRAARKLAKISGSQRVISVVPPINIPENISLHNNLNGKSDEDMLGEKEADDNLNNHETQAAAVFDRLNVS